MDRKQVNISFQTAYDNENKLVLNTNINNVYQVFII